MRVRGVDLALEDQGEGLAFLWGHGLLGSIAQEDEIALLPWPELAEQLRLLRYDARGHGRSEATLAPGDYHWPELARDMWALADALGIERAMLGGISMGSATALHAAVAAPERSAALVLMAPPTAWRTRPRQAQLYRFSARLIESFGLAPFRCLGRLGGLRVGNPVLGAMQRSILEPLRRADRRTIVAALRGAAASDLPAEDALRSLQMPALVLAWSGDPTHPVSTARRLVDLLPDAELRVARSGEEIRAWSAEIQRFAAEVASGARS